MNSSYTYKKDSVASVSFANKTKLKQSWKAAKIDLATEYKQLKDSILFTKKNKDNISDTSEIVYDEDFINTR